MMKGRDEIGVRGSTSVSVLWVGATGPGGGSSGPARVLV